MAKPHAAGVVSRRSFLRTAGYAAVATSLATACGVERGVPLLPVAGGYADGRLDARPHIPSIDPAASGRLELDHEGHRFLLYVPSTYRVGLPSPFALLLHGASGNAEGGFRMWAPFAEGAGVILLAPESNEGGAWDVMVTGFGPDVAMIDGVLAWAFDRFAVDPRHLAIGGFSNGASYALSLGLTNGDLFSHVVAMSPGGMSPGTFRGRPRLFVSHGTNDRTLPIRRTSRLLVPDLESRGYRVNYVEFDGGHTLVPNIARTALRWFLNDPTGLAAGRPRGSSA